LKRGPLIIYGTNNSPLLKGFRNLPGVSCLNVRHLNLLYLAPGGHLGRFVIWTRSAFEKLDELWGTSNKKALLKKDYRLPRPLLTNPDVTRIMFSDEVQSVLRPGRRQETHTRKKNPLKNPYALAKLNPYAIIHRRKELLRSTKNRDRKLALQAAKKAGKKPAALKGVKKSLTASKKKTRTAKFVKGVLLA